VDKDAYEKKLAKACKMQMQVSWKGFHFFQKLKWFSDFEETEEVVQSTMGGSW